ncbi:hypothetical protein CPC16_010098 [Podila verticillata]|nr:hypothetical protein BGZ52_009847 [Haplosporangium bisporale]KAF9380901.1 hypothetical protein CPC16_010098 [Podila verticillata]
MTLPELITQDPSQQEPVEPSHLTSDTDMTRTRTDSSSPSGSLSSSSHTSSTSSELTLPTSSTSTTKSGPSSSPLRTGTRGPIGPRPGVYRPCARCRVKKTKCDKAKPTCSSCQKGGPGVTCVYDNDEPSDGSPTPTPTPAKTVVKSSPVSKTPSKSDSNGSRTAQRATKGFKPKESTTSTERVNPEPEASKAPVLTGPPQKKHKSSSGIGSTMNPSPLRTSITTIKLPTKTSSSSSNSSTLITSTPTTNGQGSKRKTSISSTSPTSKPTHTRSNSRSKAELKVEIEDVDMDEEVVVADLSVKDKDTSEKEDAPTPKEPPTTSPIESNLEKAPSSTPSANTLTNVPTFRPKKHPTASISVPIGGSAGTYNYGQAKIIGELNASRPTPPFIIDKNQKARKWGRSPAVIQTLGGEVALPLWTSSQEMLLNDPRPAFVQRPVPTSSARPGTNLARLAVLRQMDNNNNSTTPERGNTPESKEGSPAPQPSGIKKKRGPRKHDYVGRSESSGTSPIALKKSLKRARTESGASGTDHLEDAREHSARSTPTPAPSSRPRTFACSFEGCGKSFMDKFHLDKHEARHVTEEIVCGIDGCTKAYNSISTVRRHQSIMHKDKKLQAEEARAAAAVASGAPHPGIKKKKSMLSKTKMAIASPAHSMSASSTRASSPKETLEHHEHRHQHYSEVDDETERSLADEAIMVD